VPNIDPTDYCPTCGNALHSSDTACTRCNALSASGAALEPHSSITPPTRTAVIPATGEGALLDRFAQKRASTDSAYPSLEEPEPCEEIAASAAGGESGRKLWRAGIGAALVALLACGLYVAFDSTSGRGDSELATEPAAQNSIPRLAPDPLIDVPFGPKNASLDLTGTIDAARLAMLRGELRDARTRLAMLPASESKRGDVRQITNELIQRELARDAAIGLARACEKAGDTPCVLRAAGDALASDVSDSEARDMLLRAVAQTGTPANGPAIIAPAAGVSVTASRRADTQRFIARRRATERLTFRRETQSFANVNDIYAKP
jgi:hypothetical protein